MSNGKASIGIFQEYHNFEISFLKKNYSLVLISEKAHLFKIQMLEFSRMYFFISLQISHPFQDKIYAMK